MRAAWGLGGLILLTGCGAANAGQSDPQACAPVEAPSASVDGDALGGAYTVRIVSTSGEQRGSTAEGQLELIPQDSAYRHLDLGDGSPDTTFTLPFYGSATIDFAEVGAVIPGDPASTDPTSPGILVIERPGRVLLRVGSDANRRGVRRFDGGFTVLQVQRVTQEGFTGTWQSGAGAAQGSGGHFCARRDAD
jgi:hypothetical protein